MTMTPEQQRAIIEKETEWIDRSFSQLDLSAFPALNELPAESPHDDRFARTYGDTALRRSAADLKKFVSDPDAEALEQVGTETGNPNFLADVRDQKAERVVLEFKRRNPAYLPTPDNYDAMLKTLAYNSNLSPAEQHGDAGDVADLLMARGYWTVENLQRVFDALMAEGLLDTPAGEPRPLSERERLRVVRLGQSGQLDAAIGEFLRCSLDGDEPTLELLQDPRYKSLCDDAVFFVFSETQLDFVETASRKAYLLRYAGSRPLTIPLLQQAWKSCQENERRRERGAIVDQMVRPKEPQPVTPNQLDELSDHDVEDLLHSSLREYAQQFRRAPGVIA